MKYRIYDSKSGEFIPKSVLCLSAIAPEGKLGVFDSNGNFVNRSGRYKVSWFTGWTIGDEEVYEGDILKRVSDTDFEQSETWGKIVEAYDRSGARGVVEKVPGGFEIDRIEGHTWAFHGPEDGLTFDWDTEVEIIGNKFQDQAMLV